MFRRFVTATALSFLLFGTVWAKDHVASITSSLVRVEHIFTDEKGQHKSVCTGFLVRPRQAITSAHCVPEADTVLVDGRSSAVLKRNDQFVLVEAPDKPVVRLGTGVRLQERVVSYGYAWGEQEVFTLARNVSTFKGEDVVVDGPLAHGMSGGPVVNQDGVVVGLNQMSNDIVGVACSVMEIRVFLASPE